MSNNAFIDLHELMHTKGWVPDWEFNEVIDLYKYNNCTSIADCQSIGKGDYKSDIVNGAWIYHLGSLANGTNMFYNTTLASFSGDLSSLNIGSYMFLNSALESFSGDLSRLINGLSMFLNTALESFNVDLPSLIYGDYMFRNSDITSFNGDLSRMTNAHAMFYGSALESFNGDLSSLSNGSYMFYRTPLTTFNGDLPSLENGGYMFCRTALTSFNGDLTSLTDGNAMFYRTPLTSFSGDLSSLSNGRNKFADSALESFNGNLLSLTNGYAMFYNTALESFNSDLSSLVNGSYMFCHTYPRNYTISYYKMENGVKQEVTTPVTSNGLKSFISNLSSLKSGYCMFGHTSTICSPLDEDSIMIIADTINDISTLDKSVESDWEYTYHNGSTPTTSSIPSEQRGILHLGYDTSIADTTNIMKYCDQIAAKGWTVYLNGALQVANNGVIETITITNEDGSPIPHYYKPVQVTNEDNALFVDVDNNYYIIIGGQHVFGDDISTYGMFTSYENAVNEISISLGLTPCENKY